MNIGIVGATGLVGEEFIKLIESNHSKNKVDNKNINWEQLVTGFKDKNTKFDYYNCEYLCPTNENYDKSNLMEDLKQNRGICEYLDTDEINTCLLSKTFDLSTEQTLPSLFITSSKAIFTILLISDSEYL